MLNSVYHLNPQKSTFYSIFWIYFSNFAKSIKKSLDILIFHRDVSYTKGVFQQDLTTFKPKGEG